MTKVSICIPNLNTRPFLPERFKTIFNQTFKDWELIVCDSYSEDGAWEYIQELAVHEPRMRISQTPRKGIYAGFNDCVKLASGDYVYIATSDDTMTPDCLDKMVAALESHPECGLAHCSALFIDERGHATDLKWEAWPFVKYFKETIKVGHIRPPGHDAVLAFALGTPYFSITQILIRRSLFEKVGFFENKWGSFGDLEWQMRTTLFTSTVHIPEHLVTWRIHPLQATQSDRHLAAVRDGLYVQMADSIIDFSHKMKAPRQKGLPYRLRRFVLVEHLNEVWNQIPGRSHKMRFLIKRMVKDPLGTIWFLQNYFRHKLGRPDVLEQEVRHEIKKLAIPNPVVIHST